MADWGYDDEIPIGLNPAQPIVQEVSPQAVQQQLQAVPVGQQLQPAQPLPPAVQQAAAQPVGVQPVQGPQGSAPWTANPYHPEQNIENSPAEQQRALDLIHGGQDLLKSSALKLQQKQNPGIAAFAAMFGNRSGLIGKLGGGLAQHAQNAKNEAFAQNQAAVEMLKLGHAMVKDGSIDSLTASQKAYTDQQNQFQKSQETEGKNDRAVFNGDTRVDVANINSGAKTYVQDVKKEMQDHGFQHDDAKVAQTFENKVKLQKDSQGFQAAMKAVDVAMQNDRLGQQERDHLLQAKQSIQNNLLNNQVEIEKHNSSTLAKYYKVNPKTGKSGFYNEKGEPVDPSIFMIDTPTNAGASPGEPAQVGMSAGATGSLAALNSQARNTPAGAAAPTAIAGGVSKNFQGISDHRLYGPGYPATAKLAAQKYLITPGTLDLSKRQMIANVTPDVPAEFKDKAYGSEYSARDNIGKNQMVYPTIYDGKTHSREEAFKHAQETGQHMGIFRGDIPEDVATEYENALHSRPITVNGHLMNGDVWKALNNGTLKPAAPGHAPIKTAMHAPAAVSHGMVPPPPAGAPSIAPGIAPPAYTPPQNLSQVAQTFKMTPEQTKQKFVEYATKTRGIPLAQAMQLADSKFGK